MKVLVAYASRHGSTAGIADRVAETLRTNGVEAASTSVGQVSDLGSFDAVVVGGAAYMFHWLRDATAFVKRHGAALAEIPVWLFSSGPLGTDDVDKDGRDVFEATRPKEWAELAARVGSHGERVFRGAWTGEDRPIGMGERMLRLMPASRDTLPVGDFREWDEIDEWAARIAGELKAQRASGA